MRDFDALIVALTSNTEAVKPYAAERRLAAGIGAGAFLTLVILLAFIGVRPDLPEAAEEAVFWGKILYTASLGAWGLLLTLQLARPEKQKLRWLWLSALPLTAITAFSALEISQTAPDSVADLFLGSKWICLPLVAILSIPIFAGLIWFLRRMAPTQLHIAGAAAGFTAGGFAATIYCLYCQQASATYILTRYTVAIALVSAAGAVLGPRLLRW